MPSFGDDNDFFILTSMLAVPAIVVFVIVTFVRVRRNRFHRQRITKGHFRPVSPEVMAEKKAARQKAEAEYKAKKR